MNPADQQNIIILETNSVHRDYLRSIISGWGYTPFSFEKETICLDNMASLNPDLIILGSLSLERIFRFINTLNMRNCSLPVLIISGDQSIHDFIITNGFANMLAIKTPIESSIIKRAIGSLHDNMLNNKIFQDCPLIIGNSPAMVKIKKMLPELSRSKETVLIQGETGTGKELVARAIHYQSDRRTNPFIKVNASALPCELFESELFGYKAGAFAGTRQDDKGIFEVADTGTIFLDKIGEMPASLQANLLQVLEGEGISKLDFETKETIDVRIIAAADKDLGPLVETEGFRKDLYYRLNVINITIPPLRNRIEDILLLAVFFNDKFCGELGKSHYELSKKVKNIFRSYHWPGNVRELKKVVKDYVLMDNEHSIIDKLCPHNQIHKSMDLIDYNEDIYTLAEISDVKEYLKDLSKVSLKDICREFVTRTEKKLIRKALEKTNWNRKKAAILLGISYKSLLNKIKAYGLT